jgi:site-specific recombinase XerD
MTNLPAKANIFVNTQNSPNTKDAYRLDLSKWFAFMGDNAPSVELVVEWKDKLELQYAPATASRIFSTVRSYYDWLRRQNLVLLNPFEAVKRPRKLLNVTPSVPSDEQVERILDAVDLGSAAGKRHYAILCLLLNGLRAQEVCDLRVRDLPKDNHSQVIRVIGKGMKERMVPLTTEAGAALSHYMIEEQAKGWSWGGLDGWLIHDNFPMGHQITRKQVAFVVDKSARLAGVAGISPHSFRHHYGTRMYRATHDLLAVQKLLGHVKPETTQIYAQLDLSDLVEAARQDPRNHP